MERLDQVICGSLQAMSLQIPITEVKIPIWFTKGKGRRIMYLQGPKLHVKRLGRKRLPNFPREFTSFIQGRDAPSWEGWKGRPQEGHGPSQERACHQTSQSVPPLSHTVSSHGVRFAPTYPTPPSANSDPPCTLCCQHVGLREAKAGSETRLGVS